MILCEHIKKNNEMCARYTLPKSNACEIHAKTYKDTYNCLFNGWFDGWLVTKHLVNIWFGYPKKIEHDQGENNNVD